MSIKTTDEFFLPLLTNVRHREEHIGELLDEMIRAATDTAVREALEARKFLGFQAVAAIEHCFKLMGARPVVPNDRLYDIFLDEFRQELADMRSLAMRDLLLLAKATQLTYLRIADYTTLVAISDGLGRSAVTMLLEGVLAEKLAFVARMKRAIAELAESEPPPSPTIAAHRRPVRRRASRHLLPTHELGPDRDERPETKPSSFEVPPA